MIDLDFGWVPTGFVLKMVGAAFGLTGTGLYAATLDRVATHAAVLPPELGA